MANDRQDKHIFTCAPKHVFLFSASLSSLGQTVVYVVGLDPEMLCPFHFFMLSPIQVRKRVGARIAANTIESGLISISASFNSLASPLSPRQQCEVTQTVLKSGVKVLVLYDCALIVPLMEHLTSEAR